MHGEPEVVSAALTFYEIPTESFGEVSAESDGTARWDSTGMLVVELFAAGEVGLGYSYTTAAAAQVSRELLVPVVIGGHPFDTARAFWAMAATVRNQGWPGVCASAISAFDLALHDLKARLLGTSLTQLLGGARLSVTAYGSGGFTSYSIGQLEKQFGDWAADGMRAVKMKVGTHPEDDLARVRAARAAIGPDVELFVDANGAYERKQALAFAQQFADASVTWFEEPVSSDDLDGLRHLRDRAPGGMRIAAGEYGYTPSYFHAMLSAGAVDVIQADGTRCGGATGFGIAAAQAQGAAIPLSAHTAPAIHASLGAALPNVVNVEYFHDHARIESLFFDGVPQLEHGELIPDRSRPGTGLTLKRGDIDRYLKSGWHSP
jgi:L-alanine-DL-glutamate epimerase-like enolase superfamily enzyme